MNYVLNRSNFPFDVKNNFLFLLQYLVMTIFIIEYTHLVIIVEIQRGTISKITP